MTGSEFADFSVLIAVNHFMQRNCPLIRIRSIGSGAGSTADRCRVVSLDCLDERAVSTKCSLRLTTSKYWSNGTQSLRSGCLLAYSIPHKISNGTVFSEKNSIFVTWVRAALDWNVSVTLQ